MDYETALKTCSEEVQAAIKWLEEKVRFDKSKCENGLEKLKELKKKKDIYPRFYPIGWGKDEILRRLKVKYLSSDALEFCVLSKVNSPLLKEFLDAAKREEFWLDEEGPEGFDVALFEDPYLLWYLSKLGLKSNEYFKKALEEFIKKPQTREGKIPTGGIYSPHTLNLRVLTSVEQDSEATDLAVGYFLDNLDEFKSNHPSYLHSEYLEALAIGTLALCELNYLKYKEIIDDLGKFLKSEQKREGYWGEIHQGSDRLLYPTAETSILIEAISRIFGQNDECVTKAVEWIKRIKKEEGYWSAEACLALISAGEGPKASLEYVEWRDMLREQELKYIKPYFVHTSPKYFEEYHVEDVQKVIKRMLHSAKSEIRILSPYIEMLHDELIKIVTEKTKLSVKVITRPKEEQVKHNQKIIDQLNKYTKGNCKSHWKLHSRIVIMDKNEVFLSSSDLNRDGLIDQYNAGIWTRDEKIVEEAIKFFENIWNESGGKTQSTEVKRR
jgi:uncharacterized protein YacL (UPF0231 family)